MDLYLRKIRLESYRVILKDETGETEIGSISVQSGTGGEHSWIWGIDTVLPMREHESGGKGNGRADCMKRFKAAWERYASDPAWLAEFMRYKRQRR